MKQVSIKVYSPAGELLKDWTNMANFGEFTKEINAGLGECIIDLAVKFDYQGTELSIGNVVDIIISDKDTTNEGFRKIYSGYISTIEPFVDGKKQGITVRILGHYTKLSLDYLKDAETIRLYSDETNGITTIASGTVADIGLILRGILNRYRAETINPKIWYSLASIPNVNQDALYSFRLVTYRNAIDRIVSMLPSGYFWYVDEDGLFSIKSKPTTPTHIFKFGKHFKSIKIEKSLEKLRNFILVWDGKPDGVFKSYSDAYSITKYGRRCQVIQDNSIGDENTMDKIGRKFLAENKDQQVSITCEIIDNNLDSINGYDIDSVQAGDTCRFVGFDNSIVDVIKDNMLITKVAYSLNKIKLEVEPIKMEIADNQKKLKLKVDDISTLEVPASYT